jgi:tRNA modification GTPase
MFFRSIHRACPSPPALRLFSEFTASPTPSILPSPFTDTIFALSSAPGRAAVAILRLSGAHADTALQQLLPPGRPLPPPRVAQLATLRHPNTSNPLDTALCLRFPAPRSATGEDVVELHVHGGPAVVRSVAAALSTIPNIRPAEPGEFTKRAFQLGRLDLTEVEGLADLLAADTEAQRVQALAAAGGAGRRQCETWRTTLIRCLAHVEAVIDFGEDDEIADEVASAVIPTVAGLQKELELHLKAAAGGEVVREGIRVVLLGAPNAGKSSLLNALAGRNAAIVADVPGTTRDLLEVQLDLGGFKVVVIDGAGVREASDPVEVEGVRRARAAAESAHIIVSLREPEGQFILNKVLDDEKADNNKDKLGTVLHVVNKIDLVSIDTLATNDSVLGISCRTGHGLSVFTAKLSEAVKQIVMQNTAFTTKLDEGEGNRINSSSKAVVPLLNRARHRHHVSQCVAALERYQLAPLQLEVAAEELRAAAMALGRVVGAIDTEAVLDNIFSEFCIGK